MNYDHIMVRFGELSTKGKNKKDFIRLLGKNIKNALKEYPSLTFDILYDHIYVKLNGMDEKQVIGKLQDVSGIYSLSLVLKTSDEIENIKEKSLELISNEEGKTFKIKCKRSNKSYPLNSEEIIPLVAGNILAHTNLKVDVHNPDISMSIEIRDEAAYIFAHTYLGAGGYPLGIGAKTMMMISGGIDSPVACYLMMKRGISIECIHFASPPYTQSGVIDKLKDLLSVLNTYQQTIRLHVIPFTKLQETIYANSDESYAITIMRRMMYRIAEAYAKKRHCLAIGNGESIGQVASQTIESINVINAVTNMPILRPCCAMDKVDIIKIARKVGTFDISIRPFEDCCTIFAPKNPKTRPHLEDVIKIEAKFDYETLIKEAVANAEVVFVTNANKESF